MNIDSSDSHIGLFPLGRISISQKLTKLVAQKRLNLIPYVLRHANGDWGLADEPQRRINGHSLKDGGPLDSAYVVEIGIKVLIRTEADRSVTSLILAEENLQ